MRNQLFFGWMRAPVHQKVLIKHNDKPYEAVLGKSNTPTQISAKIAIEATKLNITKTPSAFRPSASKVMSFSDNPQMIPVRVDRPMNVNVASIRLLWRNKVSKETRKLPKNMR